jgi:hypothetical protein
MDEFMMNVLLDQKKTSDKEVKKRLGYTVKKCITEVIPQSPLFQESVELQAQRRVVVEISNEGRKSQSEEREAKKKSFLESFVGEKHRAVLDFAAGRELWKTKEPKPLRPLKT